ncbi:MAG TPA: Hsp20/alpha crystallin family protein [Puia sp.]|nr:Hsp20/alpha crystallin family protein [Puia sp.]
MTSNSLIKNRDWFPTLYDDFFKPFNDWFDTGNVLSGRVMTIPAVNITEGKDDYKISVAAPGMKKEDFNIDVEGNMLTISCEKEENKEEKDSRQTRREYNYSSFSRSFTLPDEVFQDKIDATYNNGVLNLTLPKKEEAKKVALSKHVAVK